MIRIFQLTIVFAFLSCSSSEQSEQDNWELESTETIEHFQKGNQKIQVIYSTLNTGLLNFQDTSIIVTTFRDSLILEEIQYNLEDGDSSVWSRHINTYNSSGQLTQEIDFVDGSLRNKSLNFYDKDKLVRTELLAIIPDYNEMMELIGADTMKSEVFSFYDDLGRCSRVLALSKDELYSALTGTTRIDSTLTFNEFDNQNRNIQSLTLVNGDRTGITKIEYDELGRELKVKTVSIDIGTNSLQFEYDDRGNVTSKLMISDVFKQLIRTEYDEQNRPVKRETYRQKTLANRR